MASSPTRVVIFGAGGLGRLVYDILQLDPACECIGFLDSAANIHGTSLDGLPILGGIEQAARLRSDGVTHAIVAIGFNLTRVRIAEELRQCGLRLASAIHPLTSIAESATLGEHLIIGARATICVHARVGDHTVVSTGAIVEHDNRIGVGVFLHPAARLAGGVVVDDYATVGIGACVIPYRRVGRCAKVQPGAVVIRDVPAETIVGGVPGRPAGPVVSRFQPDPLPPTNIPRG